MQLHIEASLIAHSINEKDVPAFVLKNSLKLNSDLLQLVANQLKFNKNLIHKVPEWGEYKKILAPQNISFEQSSSEFTAKFKASLFQGEKAIDLTGGFGIDSYFLSKSFKSFIHNEPNQELSSVVNYNFTALGVENVKFTNFNAEEYPFTDKFDLIYIDPSRRNSQNQKLFKVQDCSPDLTQMPDSFWDYANDFIVKYSPLLDLKEAFRLLSGVYKVIILAEKNEVKELLFLINKKKNTDIEVQCINYVGNEFYQRFNFSKREEENLTGIDFALPNEYLFEPNATIMKGGAFKSIGQRFKLKKLAVNTHLYTSTEMVENFPGKIFKVKEVIKFDPKLLRRHFENGFVNIVCRNFPFSTNEIKEKLKVKDGGNTTIFFTEDLNKRKISIICEKI